MYSYFAFLTRDPSPFSPFTGTYCTVQYMHGTDVMLTPQFKRRLENSVAKTAIQYILYIYANL